MPWPCRSFTSLPAVGHLPRTWPGWHLPSTRNLFIAYWAKPYAGEGISCATRIEAALDAWPL